MGNLLFGSVTSGGFPDFRRAYRTRAHVTLWMSPARFPASLPLASSRKAEAKGRTRRFSQTLSGIGAGPSTERMRSPRTPGTHFSDSQALARKGSPIFLCCERGDNDRREGRREDARRERDGRGALRPMAGETGAWLRDRSSIAKEQGKSRLHYCAVPTRPGSHRPTPITSESNLLLLHGICQNHNVCYKKRWKTSPLLLVKKKSGSGPFFSSSFLLIRNAID